MTLDKEQSQQLEKMDHLMEVFFRYKNKLIDHYYKERSFKLNSTKIHMLVMIYRSGKCMAVDIARQLSLTTGATTIMLNQLEADGLISRERSDKDRRMVWISLTEEGVEKAQIIIGIRNQLNADMLDSLTKEEQQIFFQLLGKIETRLGSEMKE
ncbi:MarR family transcriptional regulator [Paenibacillus sp. JX-17]|uniref:MarR family transcriptional regulator n=1 Tax=Paenibacillus lacisoli TaxID=3064525 RepID=A0ABT9C9K4_9BACL|nr:MarR family transcriptional regulator [Paenibacillus sp. JX-17]MDO7905942.1 MarR family transcriptional regulator [Paenibacillus sp. JX-17]